MIRIHPRLGIVVFAALLAAALTSGCTSPTGPGGSVPGTPPAGEKPGTVPETPSEVPTATQGETTVTVYYSFESTGELGDQKGVSGERLVSVERAVPKTDEVLKATIEAWLSGPTPSERDAGRFLAAPAGLKVRGVSVSGSVATVDLPKAFEPSGGTAAVANALGQLVYTATSVRGVKSVRLKLDGKLVTTFSGEGIEMDKPLTRAAVRGYFLD